MWQTLCMISVVDISAWQNASRCRSWLLQVCNKSKGLISSMPLQGVPSRLPCSQAMKLYAAADMQIPASMDDSTSPLSSDVGVSFHLQNYTWHPFCNKNPPAPVWGRMSVCCKSQHSPSLTQTFRSPERLQPIAFLYHAANAPLSPDPGDRTSLCAELAWDMGADLASAGATSLC